MKDLCCPFVQTFSSIGKYVQSVLKGSVAAHIVGLSPSRVPEFFCLLALIHKKGQRGAAVKLRKGHNNERQAKDFCVKRGQIL